MMAISGASSRNFSFRRPVCWFLAAALSMLWTPAVSIAQPPSLKRPAREAQKKVVKIYGAGGIRSLEAYQSGIVVSPEGHLATVWSYVLDVPPIVLLDDGSRYEAEVVDFEPTLDLALLKIDASGLPYFSLQAAATDSAEASSDTDADNSGVGDVTQDIDPAQPRPAVDWGTPVLAISNLFNIATGDEPASVMQGSVAAWTTLRARRGTFETAYSGDVLLLDLVANNPGAAGGAVVSLDGDLLGMLGKELRDRRSGAWVNYAIPTAVLKSVLSDMIAGRRRPPPEESMPILPKEQSHAPEKLGLVMIPDVLENTPAYIDSVRDASIAAQAELRPDDLVLMVDGVRVTSQNDFRDRLRRIDARDPLRVTIQRDAEILVRKLAP